MTHCATIRVSKNSARKSSTDAALWLGWLFPTDADPREDYGKQNMTDELDALDFEKRFLSDLLAMIGDRLAELDGYIDPNHPEESCVFDPMEHLAGVGMVAAQRYLASVCNWLSVEKDQAILWGPKKKGVAIAAIINSAANYWKHIEDGDGAIHPRTRDILDQIGVVTDSSYCVSNALYECGYQHLSGLMEGSLLPNKYHKVFSES